MQIFRQYFSSMPVKKILRDRSLWHAPPASPNPAPERTNVPKTRRPRPYDGRGAAMDRAPGGPVYASSLS